MANAPSVSRRAAKLLKSKKFVDRRFDDLLLLGKAVIETYYITPS
jgi:hypothetical protein